MGFDPGTPGSCLEPKADAQLLSHPGVPISYFLASPHLASSKCFYQLTAPGASAPGKQISLVVSVSPDFGVVVCPSSSTFLLGPRKVFYFQQRRRLHSCTKFGLLFTLDLRCDANEISLHLFCSHLSLSLILH